ncbi:MAG TPA: hypothetical protein VFI70_09485 [Nitrososphaeraceae archaeon]|nr:hypothetical protein [Nitrososphaeraceae archaeon]
MPPINSVSPLTCGVGAALFGAAGSRCGDQWDSLNTDHGFTGFRPDPVITEPLPTPTSFSGSEHGFGGSFGCTNF